MLLATTRHVLRATHAGQEWLDNFKWVALGAVAVGGPRIALKGLAALRHLTMDINILMTIAVAGALTPSSFVAQTHLAFTLSLTLSLLSGLRMLCWWALTEGIQLSIRQS